MDGVENLRRFMSILREWDEQERSDLRERRGLALVRRCFTEAPQGD